MNFVHVLQFFGRRENCKFWSNSTMLGLPNHQICAPEPKGLPRDFPLLWAVLAIFGDRAWPSLIKNHHQTPKSGIQSFRTSLRIVPILCMFCHFGRPENVQFWARSPFRDPQTTTVLSRIPEAGAKKKRSKVGQNSGHKPYIISTISIISINSNPYPSLGLKALQLRRQVTHRRSPKGGLRSAQDRRSPDWVLK